MSMATLTPESRQVLADTFGGELTGPGDTRYDEVRRCHNGLIDRQPALFAACRGAADVVAAVRFARAEGLELAVRGGGHSIAGLSLINGGLVIDLSLMRGVDVDPQSRTARVQGGALWSDVNREAHLHGLAVTGGAISSTGVGGYTLGGGLGWLMGACGLAVDNLIEAEVVLASGEVVRASADANEDLFWALRGGGGNFGVVTSFVFRLHPIAEVVGGLIAHPLDAAGDLLRFYRSFTAEVPDELEVFAGMVHAPDGSGLPLSALVVCHAGPRERAEEEVRPLLEWGSPLMSEVGPIPYPVINTLLDDNYPRGALAYWKSTFVSSLDDDLIDTVVERFASCPTPMGALVFEHFHGAVSRVDPEATAVPHRATSYNLHIPTVWLDPADTEANVAWTRETFEAVGPFRSAGRWLNYYSDDEPADALESAYGRNGRRLAEAKRRYDPDNVFHCNHNILPATVSV
ncbi:MAG TPA: FAD-binding oxidoreductase [Solirubrobacteraceae bacterium]|nr:FAD-binding oxidoreductase [Solirubrobacteraceae bacterium]